MSRPVLNVKILDLAVAKCLRDGDEVVRLGNAAIASLSIPPRLTIAIDHCSELRGDGDVSATDGDHVVIELSKPKGRFTSEGHGSSSLQLRQVLGRRRSCHA